MEWVLYVRRTLEFQEGCHNTLVLFNKVRACRVDDHLDIGKVGDVDEQTKLIEGKQLDPLGGRGETRRDSEDRRSL